MKREEEKTKIKERECQEIIGEEREEKRKQKIQLLLMAPTGHKSMTFPDISESNSF